MDKEELKKQIYNLIKESAGKRNTNKMILLNISDSRD